MTANLSDREKHGLRGPVKTWVVETTYGSAGVSDREQIPQRKSRHATEYSADGRTLATRFDNPDGSGWVTLYTYDSAGNLLNTTSGNGGETTTETYSYDDHERLLNVVNSHRLDSPVTFRYDEKGTKTKIQTSRPEDYRSNTAEGGTPFQATDRAPNLPGGGSATTIYDEHGRPTEVQVRDARGEVVKRAVCVYDAEGRISEERQILDNPEAIFPAEALAEILDSTEESLDDLRTQLTNLMGGKNGPYSMAYSYDTQGRVQQTVRRIFNQTHIIETNYNEYGDKSTEITKQVGGSEQNATGPGPRYTDVRYDYQYDQRGNWTQETQSYRSQPDGPLQSSTPRLRSLTYY